MKCLPATKIPTCKGNVLHDCHAEALTLRVFNHFLIRECLKIVGDSSMHSDYVRKRDVKEVCGTNNCQPFTIKPNLKLHLYCSEAPCGDASMELIMGNQNNPIPWPVVVQATQGQPGLHGRGYFSELGIVRRKPGEYENCRFFYPPPPSVSEKCLHACGLLTDRRTSGCPGDPFQILHR